MKDGADVQSHRNNYCLFDENSVIEVAMLSVIGDREEQQDCMGYELKNNEGIIVVCDGMGGHEGGQLASSIATDTFLSGYLNDYPCDELHNLLVDTAYEADQKVAGLCGADGEPLKAGSTVVAVAIKRNFLFWLSVGDSRIYIYREGELLRTTADHSYKELLERQLNEGQIDEETYVRNIDRGEALVSFLGVNGLPYIDSNSKPFEVKSGDRILLTTDGMYRLLSDDSIKNIIMNFENISETLDAIETKAVRCAKNISRDNMTVALIKVK